ncbi:hypothetical protein C8046_13335 [Serinibacter arcticus]|uniref:GmrSD restriction endonucleases N-terminal domain-containing protein n=1 Tax=Serinibacter arcticus TaxID=1655435 RepID=A0A2U1ZX46_9MICO|nr:DUF262 domain-containing protein [Serinibacter arcticus]PWD51492.1 hypothetical protein C8046_13335 [Serinibacter arcticus]
MEPETADDANLSKLLDRTLTELEFDDQSDADESPVPVTFSTQDYPVDGLVSRLERGTMLVPQFGTADARIHTAGFQRGFVWTKKQMDKFIESLLLGYPIPGIFLVKQAADNRLLVLDGQQRLETLRLFYSGIYEDRAFKLTNVGTELQGLTYATLGDERQLMLDNSFMQATIVTADGTAEVNEAVYSIFERLNSGGTQLTPHEIRMALFAGPLMDSIAAINEEEGWRWIYGTKSKRARDHELILRAIALFERSSEYRRPLKSFLNSFSADRRDVDAAATDSGQWFVEACEILSSEVGSGVLRRDEGGAVNAALAEAIIVALMEHLRDSGSAPENLEERVATLKSDSQFLSATARATADNEAVRQRLASARAILADREQ